MSNTIRYFSSRYFTGCETFNVIRKLKVDVIRLHPLQWTCTHGQQGGGSMPSEQELIIKAKNGDRDALTQIVSDCWRPLYRFISYKTGKPEEAQDIVQETFFRAFRSLSSYQMTETKFSTWLGRIAANLITDAWRKQGRTPVMQNLDETQNIHAGDLDPAEQVIQAETRKKLAAIVMELPAEQRQVIEMRILAGLPLKEAAVAMNKSEAAVKMLQQRALKALRAKMLEQGVLEPK